LLSLPTSIAAATAAATIAADPTRFPQVNMFGNLHEHEQGDHPNSFDFFAGFEEDTEFVHVVDF
jgi:hypothetical protein